MVDQMPAQVPNGLTAFRLGRALPASGVQFRPSALNQLGRGQTGCRLPKMWPASLPTKRSAEKAAPAARGTADGEAAGPTGVRFVSARKRYGHIVRRWSRCPSGTGGTGLGAGKVVAPRLPLMYFLTAIDGRQWRPPAGVCLGCLGVRCAHGEAG